MAQLAKKKDQRIAGLFCRFSFLSSAEESKDKPSLPYISERTG